MPLPIVTERQWDEGLYDGDFYDGKKVGTPTPTPGKGGQVARLGDQRPGPKVTRK